MTMHLVGPQLTTTNYRKRKEKITKADLTRWQEEWRLKCKQYKRLGIARPTFDEYVDSIFGRVKQQKIKVEPLKAKIDLNAERMKKHKEMYPSLGMTNFSPDACAKKTPQQYTGTLIKGIATMHKSNAVPILNNEQAAEIAKMRR